MKKEGIVNTGRPVYDPLDDGPVTAPRPNIYNEVSNLVMAQRKPTPTAYPMIDSTATLGDAHLASLQTIHESTSAWDRAMGQMGRLLPWAIIWAGLGIGALVVMDSDWPIPFMAVCLAIAVTAYLLNRQEHQHSAAGVERHKADLAHDLASQKEENAHELRKTALQAYIRKMEADQ